jgi:hypothetical protein
MADWHGRDLNDPPVIDEQDLIGRLLRSREAIRDGTALFNGMPIHYETLLTRYERVTSLVVYCQLTYSRYYVHGSESPGSLPRAYILHTLLLGWWTFPWGPARTLKAVITNLCGGKKRRVIDLIGDEAPDSDDVVLLTARAAEAALRAMAERGFAPGSAVRVDVTGKRRPRRYEITYDELPTTQGRDWIGRLYGVPILVLKKDAPRLKGLTIDFQEGQFTFDESTLTSPD